MEPHIKALWFKRRNDKAFGWGQNPAFEKYMDGRERISNELPVESFLLEVTEGDLTDDGAANMWELPKLKEVFKRKLMMLAAKYGLVATRSTVEKAASAQSSSAKAPTKRAIEHATPGASSWTLFGRPVITSIPCRGSSTSGTHLTAASRLNMPCGMRGSMSTSD